MLIKINDFTLPKEKLEKEYQVVNVTRWQKEERKFHYLSDYDG